MWTCVNYLFRIRAKRERLREGFSSSIAELAGDITRCEYDKTKKWGMGYYPHDGKVYVETRNSNEREFIILGNQSGQSIRDWICRC